jgi:NAD(P)H-hydrate epimerase
MRATSATGSNAAGALIAGEYTWHMQATAVEAYTSAQIRAIDAAAIVRAGGDPSVLMAAAAAAAFDVLRSRWPQARRVVVAAGRGNNGGDGWVLARLAVAAGLDALVVVAGSETMNTAEGQRARADALAAAVAACGPDAAVFATADVVVDAVLGIGCMREPTGDARALIDAVNAAARPVLALDLPSGLDADRGSAAGVVVQATVTVCFIGLKRGLVTGVAHDVRGELVLAPLGVERDCFSAAQGERVRVIDGADRPQLPARRPGTHKGEVGHVLVVGGDLGYPGAAFLAASAAARSGAGLVTLATRSAHAATLAAARPELMVRGCDDVTAIVPALAAADVCVLGPGLAQAGWGKALWSAVLDGVQRGVVDADGLNLLAASPRALGAGWVLTPHPGEAARLLGTDVATIQRDRYAAAAAIVARYESSVVLKGAGSIVASPGVAPVVCDFANPAMASGGMGDVLAGVIGALLAQGLDAHASAVNGVLAHARAAVIAARGRTRGVLAGDVVAALPDALAS